MAAAQKIGSGLHQDLKDKLSRVSTATITSQLQARGYQNCFMNGLKPLHDNQRMIGVAKTLRYLPNRPDLGNWEVRDVQRETVESIEPDEVLVIDARMEPDAGTIGDIYSQRAKSLGGAGIVTDGALRDTPAIKGLNIAVYYQSSNASTLGRRHAAIDSQVPVACAGAAVLPGDIIVGDAEGVVVIPAGMVEEIADASLAMELEEEFVLECLRAGGSTLDYFPLADDKKPQYEAWLKDKLER